MQNAKKLMQNNMKRTGQVYKGFQQGTVIQRSVSNSFLESFSNARNLQDTTRFFVEMA